MKRVSKSLIITIVLFSSLVFAQSTPENSQKRSRLASRMVSMTNAAISQLFFNQLYVRPLQAILLAAKTPGLLGWKVGDTLNFTMQMKPLPQKGTMSIRITSDTAEGYVMEEDVDMSFLKQKIEILFDRDTGEVKKMTMNGKPQQMPGTNGTKLIKDEEAHITVPAGSFDCIHMVTEDADHQRAQTWLNPADLPIQGILKTKSEAGGIFEVNTELTSFARGQ